MTEETTAPLDGGPAFPFEFVNRNQATAKVNLFGIWYHLGPYASRQFSGLSARDYFAAQALPVLIMVPYPPLEANETARRAYALADAMLREREIRREEA